MRTDIPHPDWFPPELVGNWSVPTGASITTLRLLKVAGDLVLEEGSSLTAPNLQSVSGSVTLEKNAVLTAPLLWCDPRGVWLRDGARIEIDESK